MNTIVTKTFVAGNPADPNWPKLVADAFESQELIESACAVEIHFIVARPAKQTKAQRLALHPTGEPWLLVDLRATLDGMDGVAYAGRSLVASIKVDKRYASAKDIATGAWLWVAPLPRLHRPMPG